MNKNNKKYPRESAGWQMVSNIPILPNTLSLQEIKNHITKDAAQYETIDYIYLVDTNGVLLGVFSIKELLASGEHSNTNSIAKHQDELITVSPYTDQEKVALKAMKYKLKAIPVVGTNGKLLGIITSDQIRAIINLEITEDMLKSAGVEHGNMLTTNKNIIKSLSARLPWLIFGLFGGLLAVNVIEYFEVALEEEILLAAFIPLITYMADAVGTQTQIVFIRSIAIKESLNQVRYLLREMILAFLLSSTLAAIIFAVIHFIQGNDQVASVVGLALLITVNFASLIGVSLPMLFHKLKIDPATASGPFATIIRDLLSLIIYLTVASIIL